MYLFTISVSLINRSQSIFLSLVYSWYIVFYHFLCLWKHLLPVGMNHFRHIDFMHGSLPRADEGWICLFIRIYMVLYLSISLLYFLLLCSNTLGHPTWELGKKIHQSYTSLPPPRKRNSYKNFQKLQILLLKYKMPSEAYTKYK